MHHLRCALLTTAAVIGFASIASAADMPIKAPAPVIAPLKWYVSLYGGWSKARDYNFDFVSNTSGVHIPYSVSLDNGWVIGGTFGREVTNYLRIEVDVSTSHHQFSDNYASATFVGLGESGSMRMTTVTGNAWVSAPVGPISLYAGGGAGVGFVRADLTLTNGAGAQFSGSDSGFALVGGAGVRYAFTSNIEGDLGYRYRTTRHVDIPSSITAWSTTSVNIVTQAIQGGLTFKF